MRTERIILSLAAFLFLATAVLAGTGQDNEQNRIKSFAAPRAFISEEEAVSLEAALRKNPDDMEAREKLLMKYGLDRFRSPGSKKLFARHVFWVIRNRPDSRLAETQCILIPAVDGPYYEKGRKLWLKQVRKHSGNPVVIGNAARFIGFNDTGKSAELLLKCRELDRENPKWPYELGMLCSRERQSEDHDAQKAKAAAAKAVVYLEEAYGMIANDDLKFSSLNNLAKLAFEAGDIAKARKYGLELLDRASENQDHWSYGNAVFDGNLVLGRAALAEGKTGEAKEFLMKSAEIAGSPQLNTFGPNLTLAKDLLEKGEKDAVLKFFRRCSMFWKGAEPFVKAIENGEPPKWGANLYY